MTLLLVSLSANAQFGDLLKNLKNAAKQIEQNIQNSPNSNKTSVENATNKNAGITKNSGTSEKSTSSASIFVSGQQLCANVKSDRTVEKYIQTLTDLEKHGLDTRNQMYLDPDLKLTEYILSKSGFNTKTAQDGFTTLLPPSIRNELVTTVSTCLTLIAKTPYIRLFFRADENDVMKKIQDTSDPLLMEYYARQILEIKGNKPQEISRINTVLALALPDSEKVISEAYSNSSAEAEISRKISLDKMNAEHAEQEKASLAQAEKEQTERAVNIIAQFYKISNAKFKAGFSSCLSDEQDLLNQQIKIHKSNISAALNKTDVATESKLILDTERGADILTRSLCSVRVHIATQAAVNQSFADNTFADSNSQLFNDKLTPAGLKVINNALSIDRQSFENIYLTNKDLAKIIAESNSRTESQKKKLETQSNSLVNALLQNHFNSQAKTFLSWMAVYPDKFNCTKTGDGENAFFRCK